MILTNAGGFENGYNPEIQYILSTMAESSENRTTFIQSLTSYIQKYALNGVDIGI